MSAGTIALTNNSSTVTGTGTSFTTELKPGDFVYVTVGGAPYTLVASSVTSDTQLTLAVAFDGPTTTGLAWNAVPASLQVAITQKILNDFAQVARGRILDFQNWQKIYSSDQSVTVTRPDRTTFTGPSWGYMAAQYDSKANTADVLTKADNLNSLTDKATARSNLGLGDAATKSVGTVANTVAAGNDSRLTTIDGKSGGTITTALTAQNSFLISSGARAANPANGSAQFGGRLRMSYSNVAGRYSDFYIQENVGVNVTQYLLMQADANTSRIWSFVSDGNAFAQGTWQSSSDERIKTNINVIEDPLVKMRKIRGYSWDRLDGVSPGRGFIAQEVQDVFPEAVIEGGKTDLKDGRSVEKTLSVDVAGVAASLHQEAILALMDEIAELQKRMKAIDGLDA
ncbi:tail fiber domain-containing protein [Pantoea dispersa]|uniref:tail fiber domain-containing protein n=1 Tax=Pantoea dispersa TaxID=59814 RepID=UPI0039BE4AD7